MNWLCLEERCRIIQKLQKFGESLKQGCHPWIIFQLSLILKQRPKISNVLFYSLLNTLALNSQDEKTEMSKQESNLEIKEEVVGIHLQTNFSRLLVLWIHCLKKQ